MSRWSLRTKLVLGFAVTGVVVALLVGVLSFVAARRGLIDEIDRSLSSAATTLAGGGSVATTSTPATTGGRPGPRRPSAPDQGIVQAAQIVDAQGQVTPVVGPVLPLEREFTELMTAEAGSRQVRTEVVGDTSYRMLALALPDDRGIIVVARDLDEAQRYLGELARTSVWIGGAAAVAAAGFGWLLALRITRRLRRLTTAAEKVSATGTLDIAAADGSRPGDEVDRLATAMQTMLSDLDRSRQDQRRLVQDAGHELRTPLTSLRTNLSVLRRFDELSPASRARLLDDVDGESRELTVLVNELVELATDSRAEEPRIALDLAEVAEQVAQRFRRRSGRPITVTTTGPSSVAAQPHGVERAVSNLVDNALKFDADGDRPIEIVVGPTGVVVADRGPGVDPADRDHIFDRFHRATAARSLPGSGLGLAIVKDVALRHGGTVTVADRPGGGALIGFDLGRPEVLPGS